MAPKRKSIAERFWPRVAAPDAHKGCRVWLGARDRDGYGVINERCAANVYRQLRAHRVAWSLTHGNLPESALVLHSCDNPPCVNPAHLFLGSNRDNVHDMIRKGRKFILRGERHHMAKLSESQVRAIRKERSFGLRLKEIAKKYGISQQHVSLIARGGVWRCAQ